MTAPIVEALGTVLSNLLKIPCWDGEVPRYDTSNQPIGPSTNTPVNWPVLAIEMKEDQLFKRTQTFTTVYSEAGPMYLNVWGTTRAQVKPFVDRIETWLSKETNWPLILDFSTTGFYVIQALLLYQATIQMQGIRTAKGELLYKGILVYNIEIHGKSPN